MLKTQVRSLPPCCQITTVYEFRDALRGISIISDNAIITNLLNTARDMTEPEFQVKKNDLLSSYEIALEQLLATVS